MAKICHIEITGINEMPRVLREANSARQMGLEVTIVGEGLSGDADGIPFIGFEKAANRFERILIRSNKMVEEALKTNPDIIQIHSPELLLYTPKMKSAGKKVVFDSHECYVCQIKVKGYIPRVLRRFVSCAYSVVESYFCKRIDCVIYPSTIGGKNFFENRAKRSVKIENFSLAPCESPTNIEKKRQVIYAGALTPDRGIDKLADAILQTDATLILCGAFCDKAYEEQFLSAVSSKKIMYLGRLNRKELFGQYAACTIGMCTLLPIGQYAQGDNMSTKIYEYMQCGLPVICSNFPYAVRQNEQYHFGICVDPENVDEIAAAIRYLLDHPDEAKQMGENGRRAVKEEFNWGVEEQKLFALYADILRD